MLKINKKKATVDNTSQQTQTKEKGTLLIVDDEIALTTVLNHLFSKEYEVRAVNSGQEALEIINNGFNPHVIIADQRMPGMSGAEFLAESQKVVPNAVRVILTGYTDVNDIVSSINQGNVYKFITKPWKNDELLQEIRLCYSHYELTMRNTKLLAIVQKQYTALEQSKKELEKRNQALIAMHKQTKASSLQTVRILAGLVGVGQDYYYSSHSQTVAIIARAIGETLELSAESLQSLTTAALLIDIGKVGLDKDILLQSPAKLSGKQRQLYEQYVQRGYDMLKSIRGLEKIALIIHQHQERYDGLGFPEGLESDSISIEAQILHIADMYHDVAYRIPFDTYKQAEDPSMLVQTEAEIERAQSLAYRTVHRRASAFQPDVFKKFQILARAGVCTPLQVGSDTAEDEIVEEEKSNSTEPKAKTITVPEVQMGMILFEPVTNDSGVVLMPRNKIVDYNCYQKLKDLFDAGIVKDVTVVEPLINESGKIMTDTPNEEYV
jgi:response regulator RpfG family c-di-GMP phosphodiesterase